MYAISAPAEQLLCATDLSGVPAHEHGADDDGHDHPAQTHDCCHAFLAVPFAARIVAQVRPPIEVVALFALRAAHHAGVLDRPPNLRLA